MLDDTAPQARFKIGFTARTVPAGWYRDGDQDRPKLTVAFGLRPEETAQSVGMENAPSHLFMALGAEHLSLQVRAVTLDADGKIMVPEKAPEIEFPKDGSMLAPWAERPAPEMLAKIDSLWRHVMPEHPNDGFEPLYDAMKAYTEQDVPAAEANMDAVADYSGQIAITCQIERALVERMAIFDRTNWQSRVLEAAVRVADAFYVKNRDDLKEVFKDRPDGGPESDEKRVTSMTVSKRKAEAATKIVDGIQSKIAEASKALGAALCGDSDAASCRELLRQGPADDNLTANMMRLSFEGILTRLFYLNQVNIRASAMGTRQADAVEEAAKQGKDIDDTDKTALTQPSDTVLKTQLFLSRFKELETNGEFGRLFGLTQDFTLTESALETIRAIPAINDPLCKPSRYIMIRVVARTTEAEQLLPRDCSNWTLAKITFDDKNDRRPAFVPVCRHEVVTVLGAQGNCDARDCEVLPELDGVRLLSAHGDGKNPAYELSSINPRDAMQDLDTRLSTILAHVYTARQALATEAGLTEDMPLSKAQVAQVAASYGKSRPEAEPWPLAALKSRALRLFHHHQCSRINCELGRTAKMEGTPCDTFALDSEDLSIGWMYDGSIRCFDDQSEPEWNALSGANIRYYDATVPIHHGQKARAWPDEVVNGFFVGQERARYQRAAWALAQQTKEEKDPQGGEETRLVTVADELVYEYAGEQQGTDNAVGEWNAAKKAYVQPVLRKGLLDIGRQYLSIQTLDHRQKPLELLNGLGNYLGARNIHVGGTSVSDETASAVLSSVPCASVPRRTKEKAQPGHRLLRTEKIAKPLVLLNGFENSNQPGKYFGTYQPNTARSVTLRSKLGTDGKYRREGPYDRERLIVLPGMVDLDLAYRNGVLPKVRHVKTRYGNRPPDGLRTARMDGQGGWLTLDEIYTGDEGKKVLAKRRYNDPGQKTGRTPSSAVFHRDYKGLDRKTPYYPEPLHGSTAFRLRQVGTRDGWIGKAVIVENTVTSYPDVTPVSVTLKRGFALQFERAKKPIRFADVSCVDMTITLPPGLEAELVVWPIPDLARFAITTELVTLQAMVSMAAKPGLACIDGLQDDGAGLDPLTDCLAKAGLLGPNPANKTCGIACEATPDLAQLKSVATVLHKALQEHPIDVIGGHSRISVTHAVDKPSIVPQVGSLSSIGHNGFDTPDIVIEEAANKDIFARRSDPDPLARGELGKLPALLPEMVPLTASSLHDEGNPGLGLKGPGTDVDLIGYLKIDPLTTGAVEIDVKTGNPLKGAIDDPSRTRGASNVIGSVYPKGAGKASDALLKAKDIYGFDIFPDEQAKPISSKLRLARIENIPPFAASLKDHDLEQSPWQPPVAYLALHTLFDLATNADQDAEDKKASRLSSQDGISIDVEPILSFSQARSLGLRFRAIGRFANAMTTRRTSNAAPKVPDVFRELEDEKHFVNLPLPSSRRPDPPAAAVKPEIVPLPDQEVTRPEDEATITFLRKSQMRLSFKRPLLSSGPTERIGIVLSPRPSSFGTDGRYEREFNGVETGSKFFRLSEPFSNPKNVPPDLADRLTEFADKGTRPPMAKHPQEYETGPYGFFPVPLPILADGRFDPHGKWCGTHRDDVGYVANAQLPIYEDANDPGRDGTRPAIFYPVDLLTYVPRYDVAKELWYCNVTLDPRHTLDPHLQLGVVRYQPYAPRDLRVSPIGDAFRCKLLPCRKTTVARSLEGDAVLLTVTTTGPAALADEFGKDMGPRSLFTARLTGVERHSKRIVHRHLDQEYLMTRSRDHATVTGSFRIPRRQAHDLDIMLTIEEVEMRYSSTLSIEPVLPDQEQDTEESGPLYRLTAPLDGFVKDAFKTGK
ncbi:hypothetical protein [Leisingera sp. JC1]|uniref:hypothetical protein n=1 Tax=Leisingera sp. JC1 TaxID=1855282 RepID=UPI0008037623|nr:hypothetical protein [Leisingera sp. JC1]OBY25605.1 hypothetical protein A9D60_21460 [Leisingera sp. JC1]